MDDVRVHYKNVNKALRRSDLSGTFIVSKYRTAPYMACQHRCAYCDGRAERYYVEGDFDSDITVRPNLPDLLRKELPKLREKGVISFGSGITDTYQPIEKETGIVRQCAKILSASDFPVTVMTKSSLPLRDIELWNSVNTRAGFMILVSLVHSDDRTRQQFEPEAAPVEERFQVLREFRKRKCAAGILAMPLLPGINDTDENLELLYQSASQIGVDFLMPGGLTLRPGRQKEHFLRVLAQYRPDLLPVYTDLYRENRPSGAPLKSYDAALYRKCLSLSNNYHLPYLVPHRIYQGRLHLYDEVSVLLRHMEELYNSRRINTKPLKLSIRRFHEWLTERKKLYNRKRSWLYTDLDGELIEVITSGKLGSMIGNKKLSRFIREVAIERKTFDYSTLSF
ncbi:MAG: radical SAM protein [Spirochaetia bacterium]